MQADFRRRLRAASLFFLVASTVWTAGGEAWADAKDHLTGKDGVAIPLQQVIRSQRAPGPIFIAVPVAYVFGLGGDRSPTYCSPSIRATNSSNAMVEELIIGIDFHTKAGQAAGGSISRYGALKVGHQDTHYFYQLSVNDCRGLEGQVEVVRCVYTSGQDCSKDVRVIGYGTIPLRMKPSHQSGERP